MTHGQQRPANPHRFAVFRSKPFPDGRPPSSEFSFTTFIPLEVLHQLHQALATGQIQPDTDRNGVLGVTLWGSGYRGTGQPNAPVMSGSVNTHKALWQQQQAAQQGYQQPAQQWQPPAGPTLPGEQFPAPAAAAPAAPAPMPVAPLPPAPAQPTPQPAWGGNQWAAAGQANAELPF